jgi:hypothetical protein
VLIWVIWRRLPRGEVDRWDRSIIALVLWAMAIVSMRAMCRRISLLEPMCDPHALRHSGFEVKIDSLSKLLKEMGPSEGENSGQL